MFQLIFFLTIYPVLLIFYFVNRLNFKWREQQLFSVIMKKEWTDNTYIQQIISIYKKQIHLILFISLLIPFSTLLTDSFSIQFTIWMLWLLFILLSFYLPYISANKKVKSWKKEYHADAFIADEDNAWIGGFLYYNPNDKHLLVESRIGIGATLNASRLLGKITYLFSFLILLLIPVFCVFVLAEEYIPINLYVTDETLYAKHVFQNYEISLSDIKNVSVVDEIPNFSKKSGTDTDTVYHGTFHIRNQGDYEVFLNPNNTCFLSFSANDTNYYFSGMTDKQTLTIYHKLIK